PQKDAQSADLHRLDELLDRWNVPEKEVINLIIGMSPQDKIAVSTLAKYRKLLASAFNVAEMTKVVQVLPLTLTQKLGWISDSALLKRVIDYEDIRPLIVAAPQVERDALNTPGWMNFFVTVCTKATMLTAVRDLKLNLVTSLTWIKAQPFNVRIELAY